MLCSKATQHMLTKCILTKPPRKKGGYFLGYYSGKLMFYTVFL